MADTRLDNDTDEDGDSLTAALVGDVAHGTLTLASDGSFTYDHDGSETTSDRFTYRANDGKVDSNNVGTVTITVTPVNDAPEPNDDVYAVDKSGILTVDAPSGVLANDIDSDGDSLSAKVVDGPIHGTLTLGEDGSFTYEHDGSGTTVDGFSYEVTDGQGTGVATVTIFRLDPYNQQAKITAEESGGGGRLGFSSAIDGNTAAVGTMFKGLVVVFQRVGNNWVQQAQLRAPDRAPNNFGYSLGISGDTLVVGAFADDDKGTDAGAAYVFVRTGGTWVFQAKLLPSDDTGGQWMGWSVAISGNTIVAGAHFDSERDFAAGAAHVFGRNGIAWTHQAKLLASDAGRYHSFGFSVDIHGDTALIGARGVENGTGAAYVFVRSAGRWEEQQRLGASDATQKGLFGAAVAVDGDIAVIGARREISSDVQSVSAYVFRQKSGTWTQQQILRAGNPEEPAHFGRFVAVGEGKIVLGSAGAGDRGINSGAAYVFVGGGGKWNLQQRLTAADGDDGDLFGSSVAVSGSTILVGATFDEVNFDGGSAYVFDPAVNTPPSAEDDAYSVGEGGTLTVDAALGVLANDVDVDANPLNAERVSPPTHGTLVLNPDGSFAYVHDGSETVSDSFTYIAGDGIDKSAPATVSITVDAVNDRPVAENDTYTVTEGGTLINDAAAGVLVNDRDADGNPLTAVLVSGPVNGELTLFPDGSFDYRHNGTEPAFDSFTYRANDGTVNSNNIGVVTIAITPVNDPPLTLEDSYSVSQGGTLEVGTQSGVLSNDRDAEGSPLTAVLDENVVSGQLVLKLDGSFSYTHGGGPATVDSFTYHANDGAADSEITRVTINVSVVNVAPVVFNDSYSVAEGGVLTAHSGFGVLTNDTDLDGDPLTAVLVDDVKHGKLSLAEDGSFTYEHDGSETRTDGFSYRANDGTVDSNNVARVNINVIPVNDPPIAVDDEYRVDERGQIAPDVFEGVVANDIDEEGALLNAVLVRGASHGSLTLFDDGSFVYRHDGSQVTSDSFAYRANDGAAVSNNVAVVTIIIALVNDPPEAVDDLYKVDEDGTLNVDAARGVLANDSDPEGDRLKAVLVDVPSHGTVILNPNGRFTYVHDGSETDSDSFSYEADDGAASSGPATVLIEVIPVNDRPVAVNDAFKIDQGGSITIGPPGVLANDRDAEGDPLKATLLSDPQKGSLTFNDDGSFTYTHAGDDTGFVRFTYRASDGIANSNAATVTIVPLSADLTVTKTQDTDGVCTPSDCSLREAIKAARAGFTIEVPEGTYTLTLGFQLNVNKDLKIKGAGAESTIIEAASDPGAADFRVFDITGGRVEISGVTIRHGNLVGSDESGAGINNSATLRLTEVTISDNRATGEGANDGGGINNLGTLELIDSTVSNNASGNRGGGINNVRQGDALPGRLSLNGTGISGNSANNGGGIYNRGTADLTDSIVSGNTASIAGGIRNDGNLTLTGSTVSGNSTTEGGHAGGIRNTGTLTLSDSNVDRNISATAGGGIFNSGTATLRNTIINGNKSGPGNSGAGIYNCPACGGQTAATVLILNSTINGNVGGAAAGIHNEDGGIVMLENTTVSGNSANNDAGGIGNDATMSLTNSTVSGNSANDDNGGGLLNRGALSLTNVTITRNSSLGEGSGLYNQDGQDGPAGSLHLVNSIIADNSGGGDCAGALAGASLGHNLDGDGTCQLSGPGDISFSLPLLRPLTDNGGPTFTHALLDGSPAIDAGDDSAAPETDQRGVPRPQGSFSDIGAYELQAGVGAPTADDDLYDVAKGGFLSVSAAEGVLSNDNDPEGDPRKARLVDDAGHGTLRLFGNGAFSYVPEPRFEGTDFFTYVANDGELDSNVATVTITVGAKILTVTKTTDTDGDCTPVDCSLREAIKAADDGDTVVVRAGTYTLSLGREIVIGTGIKLEGAGADGTIIQAAASPGAATHRVIHIATPSPAEVTISGVTIRHGRVEQGGGGGISNDGILIIKNSVVVDNTAGSGGGIRSGVNVTVIGSTISGNTALGDGGGILSNNGTLTVVDSTISDNIALGNGGGIFNSGGSGSTANLERSTVSGNRASGFAGAIYNHFSTMNLINSTVSNNTAGSDGGGIRNDQGILALTNSTVAGNRTGGNGGAGIDNPGGGSTTLANTIVANNFGPDCSGNITSLGYNLDSDGRCHLNGPGDLPQSEPRLAPLGDNGGPTFTHEILPGSPAIDAADDSAAPETDQRGVARPQGRASDIGAFEVEREIRFVEGDADGDGAVGLSDLRLIINNFGIPSDTRADLRKNGIVDIEDLAKVGMNFGR